MQRIFQNAKKVIATCLVTVLLITGTLVSFPAPARAVGDVVIIKCETECGNTAAFVGGVISGSAVTLAATGGGHAVAAGIGTGIAAVGHAAAASAVAAAAPVVVPVAATAAVGYGAYHLWENHHNDQAQISK
ncbi:MAG: hypothetical protein WA919_16220 [Coleofasciculaceae cyanobacterium]